MKIPGHPSTHGHSVNPYTCGSGRGLHAKCDGFSGGYDTYLCGCCCHDIEYLSRDLTDADRAIIARVRGEADDTREGGHG